MTERFVDETEWWDRVAMGADLLARAPGARRRLFMVDGSAVAWTGDSLAGPEPAEAAEGRRPDIEAYMFRDISDREILRRINGFPDEVPLDVLRRPHSIYCRELSRFVSVNAPAVSLSEHLAKLRAGGPS
jgi:hypothetical protein